MRRREFITLLGGAAAAWPLATRAQPKLPTIGVLWHANNAAEEAPFFQALLDGLKGVGYVDGRNIRLEHRFPNESPERFRSMAAELVSLKVDVLVSVGTVTAPYAKNATTTIPVVFTLVANPVESKLVNSLARPGGNVTGLTHIAADLIGKRLQVLKEVIPGLSRIGLLLNPNESLADSYKDETQVAASKIGFNLQIFEARSDDELERVFDAMVRAGVQAVSIAAGGFFYQRRAMISKLALERRLPTCVTSRSPLEAGAFMSYGADYVAIVRRTAVFVDQILKGAKPADLPVEQPTKFELIINLKTAKVLGID